MKETVTMLNQQYVVPEGLQPYQGVTANSPWLASETEKRRRKICDSLEEAIRRSGLKNGMTISFHHAFRGGDKVVNMVATKLSIWWRQSCQYGDGEAGGNGIPRSDACLQLIN